LTDLDPAAIEAHLARFGARLLGPVVVVDRTASTNDDAKRAAAAGAPAGAVFLADEQTGGRGRGGRAWHSPPGENLYMSTILRPRLDPRALAPMALAVGVAVARVVERAAGATAWVKWPNDVLVGGRKIAGVLVEGQLRGQAVASLVVGVGVNVHARVFPEPIAATATSLVLLGARDPRRGALAAELLVAIDEAAATFERRGLAPFLDDLAARDALAGRRVAADGLEGTAIAIEPDGRLLVRDDEGRDHRLAAGEVHLGSDALAPRAPGAKTPPA
jgi:BirA family biotin operon repressor/biotin-[acetyl-CoA-carboxylase] ligase